MAKARAPLIWALTGRNAGDNAQALALARAVTAKVGGDVRDIPLRFNLWREAPWLGASLRSLASAPPSGPWPDMVIGVGRRAVPVARWIRAQNPCRLVWIGRPRAATKLFDLVLTTPQYGVPAAPNVRLLSLPFAADLLQATPIAPLMIIGGNSWANRLTPRTIDRLSSAVTAATGGGDNNAPLRITTSPRTPATITDTIAARFPAADMHRFGSGPNPYRDWLSEASACITTGDSVSLIADAVSTGAPTYVALPDDAQMIGSLHTIAPALATNWLTRSGNRPILAPPPYPAAVLKKLEADHFATSTADFVLIRDARAHILAEHKAALAEAAKLLT